MQAQVSAELRGRGGSGQRLAVVATFSILGDMVQNVGGELVEVTTLVGPGGDAHTFEPTPADSARLAEASVVVENGLEFEPWLDDLYAAAGSHALRVIASDGVETITTNSGAGHSELDPHIWHDVQNAMVMVANIRDGLAAADPTNAAVYQANADAYTAQLQELDAFVQAQVAEIPQERRKLITSHDTFGYFAHRYGFTIVGSALGSASTETADPAASDIAALVEEIRASGVPAIFAENVANPSLMQTIAREANVQLGPPLYTDALGDAGSDGSTYIEMIRSNTAAIVSVLKE